MANTKISQLTANTNPSGNEELVYAYNNANGKMTTNTLKTFIGSGKQDTLVSGTNIKTINNTSLLGSGNITISGGGGGAGFDCIVDTAGTGDYTTLSDALTAGETSIFIKNGTYNETSKITITTPSIYIKGESEDGVIINIEKSNTETTHLGYITFDATGYSSDVTGRIENLTFNFTIGNGQQSYFMVYAEDKALTRNIEINNCYINTFVKDAGCYISTGELKGTVIQPGYELKTNILTYNNCLFNVSAHSSVVASDVSCRFLIGRGTQDRLHIDAFNSCQFNMDETGHGRMYIHGNCNECNFWVDGNEVDTVAYISIGGNCKGCFFDCGGYYRASISGHLTGCTLGRFGSWLEDNTKSTAVYNAFDNGTINYWEESTAYSIGDVVINDNSLWYCIEAHTSGGDMDFSKFEEYTGHIFIGSGAYIDNCRLGVGGDVIICNNRGILSNNLITLNDSKIYMSGGTIFKGNSLAPTVQGRNYNIYTYDNCILSSNYFNFSNGGNIEAIGSNNIFVNNMLNTQGFTPTITVAAGQNNILDNNVISNNTHLW